MTNSNTKPAFDLDAFFKSTSIVSMGSGSEQFQEFLAQYKKAMDSDSVLVSSSTAEDPFSEITDHHHLVAAFMRLSNQTILPSPGRPSDEVLRLRARLHLEETLELIKGLGITVSLEVPSSKTIVEINKDTEFNLEVTGEVDLDEIADGIADSQVISTGTALSCGMIVGETLQREVDMNNLYKFRTDGDGYRREDGKWIKPSDHPAPRINRALGYPFSAIEQVMSKFNENNAFSEDDAVNELMEEELDGLQAEFEQATNTLSVVVDNSDTTSSDT